MARSERGSSVKASTFFLGGLLLGAVALAQQETAAVRADDVGKEHVGKKVAVEGRVYSNSKTEAGIHLYFSPDTSSAFQAIVTAKSVYKFQVDVVKKYDKRNVRVTGKVEEQDGKYFIRIDDPNQIKVVPRKTS
jgi:aspartyl/asparaginyl-tRNA synthetase